MKPNAALTGGTLGGVIVTALNRYPERIAFLCEGRSYSYREVAERISQAIQLLRSLGLKKGDGVVQLTRNRPEQWFLMAAIYLTGLRSVMLHPMGGTDDHAFVTNDGEGVIAVFDESFGERIAALRPHCPAIRHWFSHGAALGNGVDGFWEHAAAFTPAPLVDETEPEDILRLAYTGGTTGKPKGVMLSSRCLLSQAMLSLTDRDWPENPVFLFSSPISHGSGANVIPTLAKGGTCVLLPGFKAEQVLELIPKLKVSAMYVVPTMLYAMLDHPAGQTADLSSLKSLMYGAAPAAPARIREAILRWGPILCQNYGQTEAPSAISGLRQSDHDPDDLARLASCGMVSTSLKVALLDEDCNEVPEGEVGEICVRGPLVMSGYWKQPELTEAAFAGGWLHTGDLARRDAKGYLYIVDRKKDMIISGGFNVYPKEIEDILTAHPDVAACAVIGVPDDKWGEAVKAIIVPRAGRTIDPAALLSLVRERRGPVYTPKTIDVAESLPLTAYGKPDKATLRKGYWQGRARAV